MGASRTRLISRILVESLLLAMIAGAAGLIVAHYGNRFMLAYLATQLPKYVSPGLDLRVLSFTLIVSLASGVLSGILPAIRLSGNNVNEALKQGVSRTDAASGAPARAVCSSSVRLRCR